MVGVEDGAHALIEEGVWFSKIDNIESDPACGPGLIALIQLHQAWGMGVCDREVEPLHVACSMEICPQKEVILILTALDSSQEVATLKSGIKFQGVFKSWNYGPIWYHIWHRGRNLQEGWLNIPNLNQT